MIEIMAVDRTDIIESQLLEKRAAHPEAARIFFGSPRGNLKKRGKR
jgi:hypothetical protein